MVLGLTCTNNRLKTDYLCKADVTTNWKLRIPNHCRGCSSKFSLRTNSLTHKSSTTCFEWLQILEMFAERPSQPKHIRELGNSSAIASNINRRIKTAIQLWNQRHGQKRRTLSPSEILSVHYLWGQGEETEYRPPDAAPTTSNEPDQTATPPPPEPPADPDPNPATDPTETVDVPDHDPATNDAVTPDPDPDPQPDAEPDFPDDPENAPDDDNHPDPAVPTIQQVLDLLTQLDHRIASLESPAVPARQANHSCPVCRFDETNPADRPGFTACPICGCVFPNAFPTAFPVQTIEIQKPPAASPHYDPVPLINITIQRG